MSEYVEKKLEFVGKKWCYLSRIDCGQATEGLNMYPYYSFFNVCLPQKKVVKDGENDKKKLFKLYK